MAKYYFVGTFLPSLSFEARPEISLSELDLLFRDNMSDRDYHKVRIVRQFYDILNLRSLWLEEELDPKGEMTPMELEEALITRSGLPDYVYDYIDLYPKKEDRIHHFPFLLAKCFQSGQQESDSFLRNYLGLERDLRLIMTAFRAKKLGRDLSVEFQYEDPEEDLIAQLLAQQDAKICEPPEKYRELKVIFEKHGDNPLALQKAVDEYRFKEVENLVNMSDVFSIERMLAYFIQFLIIEKWDEMDKAKGLQIVENIEAVKK